MEKIESSLADLKVKLFKAFNEHPNHAGQTYVQHLLFTINMAGKMCFTSIILLVHGVLPFLFTRTASTNFKNMNQTLQDRVHKVDESIAASKNL